VAELAEDGSQRQPLRRVVVDEENPPAPALDSTDAADATTLLMAAAG